MQERVGWWIERRADVIGGLMAVLGVAMTLMPSEWWTTPLRWAVGIAFVVLVGALITANHVAASHEARKHEAQHEELRNDIRGRRAVDLERTARAAEFLALEILRFLDERPDPEIGATFNPDGRDFRERYGYDIQERNRWFEVVRAEYMERFMREAMAAAADFAAAGERDDELLEMVQHYQSRQMMTEIAGRLLAAAQRAKA